MIKKSFSVFFFFCFVLLSYEQTIKIIAPVQNTNPSTEPSKNSKEVSAESEEQSKETLESTLEAEPTTPNIQSKTLTETTKLPQVEEKKYSVQFLFTNGDGYLNVERDRFESNLSLSGFIALSLFATSLSSPSSASNLTNNLGANTILSLFLLSDSLTSTPIHTNSNSIGNRFYLENKTKSDNVGLLFGISSGNYIFKADTSRFDTVLLPAAYYGTSNPLINIYMLQSLLRSSEPIHVGIHTFDLALGFHIFPENKVDPYFVFGLGFGSCYTNCSIFRLFGRGGFRFNFENHYLFLEQEIQVLNFSIKNNIYSPLIERTTLLGVGIYL